MNKLVLIFLTAIISSIFSVGLYRLLDESESQQANMPTAIRFVNNTPSQQSLLQQRVRDIPAHTPTTQFTQAAATVTPTVVNIRTFPDNLFFSSYGGSTGSGVIISSDGYIITNNHVIGSNAENMEVTLSDNREYPAKLIGTDPTTDLALIKIEPDEPLATISYADSDSVQVGEWVLAVGNPFNLNSTVTAGIISAKARDIDILQGEYKIESFLQTDAVVNPGNSGGALVNINGRLIGINTAIMTESGQYQGYSFAVPSNLVEKVIEDLRQYGEVQRAILGVRISKLDSDQAKRAGMNTPDGVYIQAINDGSAAEDAGLKAQDIIVSLNGEAISSIQELQEKVARFRPGNTVVVDYIRGQERRTVDVILKDVNNRIRRTESIAFLQSRYERDMGWELRSLQSEETINLPISKGAVVKSIETNSVLQSTGMKQGFVISRVSEVQDDEEMSIIRSFDVSNREDLLRALHKIEDGKVLLLGYYKEMEEEWGYAFDLE